MRALSIDTVDICPWALREGLILRKLDSEADGTALVETPGGGCWTAGAGTVAARAEIERPVERQQTMTGPDNSQAGTRPISVAELLAKNGTIGAPPVGGGRRRRRRGNSDAVTVAELTGEIPIVRIGDSGDPDRRAAEPERRGAASDDDERESPTDYRLRPADRRPSHANGNAKPPGDLRHRSQAVRVPSRPRDRPERAPEPLPRRAEAHRPERSDDPRAACALPTSPGRVPCPPTVHEPTCTAERRRDGESPAPS